MKTKIFTIVLVFLFILQSILVYFLMENPRIVKADKIVDRNLITSENTNFDFEYENINKVEPKFSNKDLYKMGWIPDWDFQQGFESLKRNKDKFDSVSPFWFEPKEDGTLKTLQFANNPEFIKYSKDNNIEIIPTIVTFDAKIIDSILSDVNKTQKHINEIVFYVNNYGYAGIDLDYESLYLSNSKNFFEFLNKLNTQLKKTNKLLTFAVIPKWTDKGLFFLPQTRRTLDYLKLSEYVDQIRLMTYELNGRYSEEVAPIAPLDWIEQVIKYTIYAGVSRDKIIIGTHVYAYDFEDREIATKIFENKEFLAFYNPNTKPAVALTHKDIIKIKNNHPYTEDYNSSWGESILKYNFNGTKRIVIYMNSEGIKARQDLAKKYGIKGIGVWRLGRDEGLDY